MTSDDIVITSKLEPQIQKCICGYETKHRQCIHRHKKTCSLIKKQEFNNETNSSSIKDKEIEMLREQITLLKNQNQSKDDMINLLKEQLEKQNDIIKQLAIKEQYQNIDGSHNIVNNNTFNLNFYLNETCKNAIDFEEFISDFQVKPELFENFITPEKIDTDIHKTKIFGDLFHRNMTKYSQIERPIQTTDKSRNNFYYKSNGKWINSQENLDTFNKFLKTIEISKIQKPIFDYEIAHVRGSTSNSLKDKFDEIQAGVFGELLKEKFINGFISKYAVGKK
jgi:hypothetical protein